MQGRIRSMRIEGRKMRTWHIVHASILFLVLALMIVGCGQKGRGIDGQNQAGKSTQQDGLDFSFLEETDARTWADNYLEDFHGIVNAVIPKVTADGEISGGSNYVILHAGGAMRFKNHLYSDYKESWSGINGITIEGEEYSERLVIDPEKQGTQISELGIVAGKNCFLGCDYESKEGRIFGYVFYELSEAFQTMRTVATEKGEYDAICCIMEDGEGDFHVLCNVDERNVKYLVFSSEGKKIFEKTGEYHSRLHAFGKGRVALLSADQRTAWEVNPKTGAISELATIQLGRMDNPIWRATTYDERTIAYCNSEGVFLWDMEEQKAQKIYTWAKHGFSMLTVDEIFADGGEIVCILYSQGKEQKVLILAPTQEKEEIPTITLAVHVNNKDRFLRMAAAFNKEHPEINVDVKYDLDELNLLTQLGAGGGPVLIDTQLTGFEELEALWQPLDGFLEATGVESELLPEALSFGKIGDKTYGIVTSFRIQTLIVAGSAPANWDYEAFLDMAEKSRAALFTYLYYVPLTDSRELYFDAFKNGMEDNYFFDPKTRETLFDDAEFERLIRISEKAAKCPPSEQGKALQEGEALCEIVDVYSYQNAVKLFRRLEASGESIVGFPTKDGGRNRLVADAPLAVRKSASEEEKKIAYTFLMTILSEEVMRETRGFIPVRRDLMQEEWQKYADMVQGTVDDGRYDPAKMPAPKEGDEEHYEELIQNSVLQRPFPASLERIFDEEFNAYLQGGIDAKALSDHLQNRVRLFLAE